MVFEFKKIPEPILLFLLVFCFSCVAHAKYAIMNIIPVGFSVQGISVTPDTNRIYVASRFRFDTDSVYVIDGDSNTVIADVPVSVWPAGIGANPNTNRIYVTHNRHHIISVIDGVSNTVVTEIPVKEDTYRFRDIAANPITNRIYATMEDYDAVTVITRWELIPDGPCFQLRCAEDDMYLSGSGEDRNIHLWQWVNSDLQRWVIQDSP